MTTQPRIDFTRWKLLLILRRITQRSVAIRACVSETMLANWIRGKHLTSFTPEVAARLAAAIGCTPSEFLEAAPPAAPPAPDSEVA